MFLALTVETTNTSILAVKFKTPGNMKSMTVYAYHSIQATNHKDYHFLHTFYNYKIFFEPLLSKQLQKMLMIFSTSKQ